MAYIKNISHEEVLHLADQVSADKGQIVSKTLAQNDHVSVTLFAFSKDEEIATHDSTGDAMVLVLEGTGQFTVDGKEYILQAGDTLVMPEIKFYGKPNVLLSVSGNCRMQWMYSCWSLWKTARCRCHAGFIGLCYKRNFCGNYYFKTGRSSDSASSQSHDYTEFIYYNHQCQL